MRSDGFRDAVEALDLEVMLGQLSPSVVLRSPVADEPFVGRPAVATLFTILFRTFQDLPLRRGLLVRRRRRGAALRWRLGEREVEGVDMMGFDAQGLIDDYAVMVRPLSALVALRDAVWSQLPGDP